MHEPLKDFTDNNKRFKISAAFLDRYGAVSNPDVSFDYEAFEQLCDKIGLDSIQVELDKGSIKPVNFVVSGTSMAGTASQALADETECNINDTDPSLPHYARTYKLKIIINPNHLESKFKLPDGSIDYKRLNLPEEFARALNGILKSRIIRSALRHNTLDAFLSRNFRDAITSVYVISKLLSLINIEDFSIESVPDLFSFFIIYQICYKLMYQLEGHNQVRRDRLISAPYGINPENILRVIIALSRTPTLIRYSKDSNLDVDFHKVESELEL